MKRILISLVFAAALLGAAPPAYAKGLTAWANPATPGQVIAAINAYRAANGLYAYTQNSILMQTAQGQADYQASLGTVTHEGPGGSRPRDRAIAAGYGGGATVFVSEIIYGGGQADVETAIEWWKNSPLHNDQMLASTYIDIGAGVASNGNGNYYTAVMGYVSGSAPPESPGGGNSNAPTAAAPAFVIIPVIAATPRADGSIVHIVRTGQALWNIAAVYGVPLEEILALNGLPEWAVIFPGDEIVVRAAEAGEETPTPEEEPSATPRPTRTPIERTASGSPVSGGAPFAPSGGLPGIAAPTARSQAAGEPSNEEGEIDAPAVLENPAARWIVIAAFLAILFVAATGFIPSRPPADPDDDDPVR